MSDSVTSRFRSFVSDFNKIHELGRKDSGKFQLKLSSLLVNLQQIQSFVQRLDLFSENEPLDEVNAFYIQYLALDYYLANLYSIYLLKSSSEVATSDLINPTKYKSSNLKLAKQSALQFLVLLQGYKNILTKAQSSKLDSFKEIFNPTYDELVLSYSSPQDKRAEKIENYKLEKQLTSKLNILNEYYNDDDQVFEKFDEETIRAIYIDQLRLFSISAFSLLELIAMELEVLSKQAEFEKMREDRESNSSPTDLKPEKYGPDNDYGYTTKIEQSHRSLQGSQKIPLLISKQGKILQPFTITSGRQDIQKKVFGTGQVLPSMSVEEYLDYELANGKMAKEEVKDPLKDEDATDDSDEELEKRQWDDWKDDNPKGSGNTGGNIG